MSLEWVNELIPMKPKPPSICVLALLLLMPVTIAQEAHTEIETDTKLPSGKSQREEILKQDHEKTLKDAAELLKLTEDLKSELEKGDSHVLSVNALKELDGIEKLTKRIRGRLKRY